jgi:hypothetical protein
MFETVVETQFEQFGIVREFFDGLESDRPGVILLSRCDYGVNFFVGRGEFGIYGCVWDVYYSGGSGGCQRVLT